MDLLAACQAFVNVSERGSFTVGAAAIRVQQSVASRRVAALEERLGDRLFDRRSRNVALTTFGRAMLPAAIRLVRSAANLEIDAERARTQTLRLAMPRNTRTADLARLVAEATQAGIQIEVIPGEPADRAKQIRSGEVQIALSPVRPEEASWSVPLGVVRGAATPGAVFFVDSLRPRRAGGSAHARIWIQPEDDVPGIRDRLIRLRDSLGLAPTQVLVAASLTAATAEVLSTADLLLCSPDQAEEFELPWRPLAEIHLVRSYELVASDIDVGERVRTALTGAFSRCLHEEQQ